MRRFAGLRLTGSLPDETTILHFRHLLERHGLGKALFAEINAHLASLGHRLRTGTIVDASIVAAPSSTKNRQRARDPEMHQTRKGKQWYFGMKAHIGVDSESGLTHGLATTAANGSDVTHAHLLLHGGETDAWGDAGYQGVEKRPENRHREVDWHVAMKPGKRRRLDKAGHRRGDREAQGVVAGEGGASVPVREAPLRLFPRCVIGAWQRTRNASRCCSASRTCSSPVGTRPPDVGVVPLETAAGGENVSRAPLFAPNWCQNQVPAETGAVLHYNTANCRRCSDLP